MLEKDMFRVYWKKRCSSIPVLSKSTSNAWFDVVGLFRLSSESETSQGLVCDKVIIITPLQLINSKHVFIAFYKPSLQTS